MCIKRKCSYRHVHALFVYDRGKCLNYLKRRHALSNILFIMLVYFILLGNVCMVILCFGVTYLNFLEISSRKMSEIAGKRRHSLIYILLFYACLFDSFRKRL